MEWEVAVGPRAILKFTPIVLASLLAGCVHSESHRATLYQTTPINALLDGAYDGDITFKQLRHHGDFGLGTFSHLDGEMIALDGKFYQIRSDGKAYPVSNDTLTPFAAVVFFRPTIHSDLSTPLTDAALKSQLTALIKNPNAPYAIRIDGVFDTIKVRSVPRQDPPYRHLADVTKEQSVFEHHNVTGTLVGFWCPQYINGLNVAGFHFHFITADRTAGGHVLDCQPHNAHVALEEVTGIYQRFPQNDEFRKANLNPKQNELNAAEQGK
jgi:acetolactate decarboxylase